MTTSPSGVVMEAENRPRFECEVTHGPSGTQLHTEAPKDNGGTGMSFSPTDLVGAALATCMMTTMQLAASRESLPWGEASAKVEKRMSPPPRRIAQLVVEVRMPAGLAPEHRTRLEKVARECPVARSLHPDLEVASSFAYPD
ncbi:MAG TPA: OsmC family protein [Myxococcaceae bacterium]|nr:OsmC family protein [Myxococcaceae bacterium]